MARDSESDILPTCEELGILTGTIDQNTRFERGDFRGAGPWFAPGNRQKNLALVAPRLVDNLGAGVEAPAKQG